MCGRAVVIDRNGIERIATEFSIPFNPSMWTARYNVRPTQNLPVLREVDEQLRIDELRWGLIPFWSKEASTKFPTFNARADTVHEKPTYRGPFKSRRCLVLVDGFYEWPKKPNKDRNPRFVHFVDRRVFTIAGLWDEWTDSSTGEVVESCTIITTDANEVLQSVPHDRMPVILDGEARRAWLDRGTGADELRALLVPRSTDEMTLHVVNAAHVNYGADGPECVDPLD